MVNGQVIMYDGEAPETSDVPQDQDLPAIAYKEDGSGPLFTWDSAVKEWQEGSDSALPETPSQPTGVFGGEQGIFGGEQGIFSNP